MVLTSALAAVEHHCDRVLELVYGISGVVNMSGRLYLVSINMVDDKGDLPNRLY